MIETKVEGAVGRIIINRPEKLNAFTSVMYTQLAEALATHDADPKIGVITVTGMGFDFCAGNDLADFASNTQLDATKLADPSLSPPAHAVDALIKTRKPIVGGVQGRAIGFGATMLLHFDAVVIEEDASLLYPFVDLSLVPEACSSALLEAHVGRLKARKIIFDAQPIGALAAAQMGLATDLVAPGQCGAQTLAIAERWARRPAKALSRTKQVMNAPHDVLVAQAQREFDVFGAALADPETQARFQAMLGR